MSYDNWWGRVMIILWGTVMIIQWWGESHDNMVGESVMIILWGMVMITL